MKQQYTATATIATTIVDVRLRSVGGAGFYDFRSGKERWTLGLAVAFGLRKAFEMQDTYATRETLRDVFHQMELMRTSEPVHAALLLLIHDSLYVREKLGSVLDLVDEKRSLESLEEQRGVVLRQTAVLQRVQRNVVPPLASADLKDGRLAHLTRPGHEQNREKVADFTDAFSRVLARYMVTPTN